MSVAGSPIRLQTGASQERSDLSLVDLITQGGVATWTHPQTVSLGRLPMRATLVPYPDADQALARGASPWVRSLSGDWRFRLAPSPLALPTGFEAEGFDD
jgi:hypothetical protein